jgi:hypothetical protein
VAGLAGLGCQHPDHAVVGECGNRIHQRVDQVTVTVAPPQQDDVDYLVGVLVEQFRTGRLLHVGAHVVVGVLVPAPLLNNLPPFNA